MRDSADEKCDSCRHRPRQGDTTRGAVNVPSEEIVNRYVPFAAELEPVQTIPPIWVELSICESCDLGEGAENVFEYDQED